MRKKIVIVDDDPAICDAVSILLEEYGYEVSYILDGQKIYKNNDFTADLFLIDIWMSGIDGGELCRYLKKQEQTKHIPIIMISANKDIKKITEECGANDFLEKPFEMTELLGKIDTNLPKK